MTRFLKEGILPLALGLAALCAVSWFVLFSPELRAIRSLRAEIAAKDAEVAEALQLRAAVAESAGREGGRWEERLRTWKRRVPSRPDTGRLLEEIGDLAVRHRLDSFGLTVVPAAQPGPEDAGARQDGGRNAPMETRFRMTFRSTYRDLAEFLDDLPRMRRLLTIRSVSVKEKAGAMAAEVEASAWHRGER